MAQSALRNLQRERMDARRARIGMEPFVPQAPTKTAGQAMSDMLGGVALATASCSLMLSVFFNRSLFSSCIVKIEQIETR